MRRRPVGWAGYGRLVRHPDAPRLDLVEDLHGHSVADPYRWLEDPDDPWTAVWAAAQDELAAGLLASLPGRPGFAEHLGQLVHAGAVGVPVWRHGRAFSTRRDPGQEHAVLRVTEPDGTVRVLVDPTALVPAGTTTLDAWWPSWEGDRRAPPRAAPGRRAGTATRWPSSSRWAATRSPSSSCSTSAPARCSRARSTD